MGGWTCPIWRSPIGRSPSSRWYRSPTISGGRVPTGTGGARCPTGCPPACCRSRRAPRAGIWRFSGGSARKSGPTTRSRSRGAPACRSRSRPRSIASIRPISTRSSGRCCATRWSSSSARSANRTRAAFLGDASALLFPIDWPEPFGLVMIEAMACGTPVIAYRRGSVPGGDRGRLDGLHRRRRGRCGRRRGKAGQARPRHDPRALRAALHRAADGQGLPGGV